jgi:hypothetical protein
MISKISKISKYLNIKIMFEELIFFKPVQNNHSREFYIIGKKAKYDCSDRNANILFYHITNFNTLHNNLDDKYYKLPKIYPIKFVSQFLYAYGMIVDNFIYTIKRNIFYLDNWHILPSNINDILTDYYNEKNTKWIKKHKI